MPTSFHGSIAVFGQTARETRFPKAEEAADRPKAAGGLLEVGPQSPDDYFFSIVTGFAAGAGAAAGAATVAPPAQPPQAGAAQPQSS